MVGKVGMGTFHVLLITLIGVILIASLASSNLFINMSLTAYHFYCIGIAMLIFYAAVYMTFYKVASLNLTPPILIVIAWALFIFFHGHFLNGGLNPFHKLLLFNCGLIIVVNLLFQLFRGAMDSVFAVILIIALIECLVCLGQWAGYVPSLNGYFKITGTWDNPNVTGIFLAMAVPSVLPFLSANRKYLRMAALTALLFLLYTIVLLQCRTALIGGVIILALYGYKRFRLAAKLAALQSSAKILFAMIGLAFLVLFANLLYKAKQDSADGRKLIWKLSAQMISKKPLLGYGYGLFGRNYNLFQAQYFKQGNGTQEEMRNADFVHMAYNEFLENAVEGGILGLILISALFASILTGKAVETATSPQADKIKENKAVPSSFIVYAGVLAFGVMSLLNFSLQAIPAMCLFSIYVAYYVSNSNFSFIGFRGQVVHVNIAIRLVLVTVLWSAGLIAANSEWNSFRADRKIREVSLQSTPSLSIKVLRSLANSHDIYESYFIAYGDDFFKLHQYDQALLQYNMAKTYTSDPAIYMKAAFCYIENKQYHNAQNDYEIAAYIEPNHVAPRLQLLNLSMGFHDTVGVVKQAKEILAIKPKKYSTQFKSEQYYAYQLLKKYDRQPEISNINSLKFTN